MTSLYSFLEQKNRTDRLLNEERLATDERHRFANYVFATESYVDRKKSTIRTTGAAPESFLFCEEDVKSNQALRAPLYKVTVLINKLKKKIHNCVLGNQKLEPHQEYSFALLRIASLTTLR